MLLKILIFSFLSALVSTEKVRYDNYSLYKIHPQSEEHLQFLKDLYNDAEGLDFWKAPSTVGDYVSVVTPPEMRSEFEHSLKKRSIYSELMLENIQEAFDAQLYSRRRRDASRQLIWSSYQTLEDIYEWFEYLADTFPNIVTIVSAGQSHEGRNITGVKISKGSSGRNFFIEGGQVGADWLSPVAVSYIIDQLVQGQDPEAIAASQDFDWHIFPVVNPDGFQYSQDYVRLWLKNRRPITNTAVGVDLTKNWNSQWGVSGGSFIPASNNYIGLGPFSEVETRSLSRYIESIGSNLVGSLSFRSFGQRLLIPFAHTSEPLYNYDKMITIGRRAMGSLAVKYNTQYLVGNSKDFHDGSTGMLADWVKYRFNPPVVATYLLRDTGASGYTLPVVQVQPTCEETFDSLLAIIREAKYIDVL